MKGLRVFIASFMGIIVVASPGKKPVHIPDVKVYTDYDTLSINYRISRICQMPGCVQFGPIPYKLRLGKIGM
ncbi:MAG: hypothetical protein ABIL16_00095 [candidate division WOR-3 bacterium]